MGSSKNTLLEQLATDVRQSFVDDRTIMSFNEYFAMVEEAPGRHLRSSAQYMVDMLDYYGRETLKTPAGNVERFTVFDAPFADGEGKVSGQESVQAALYRVFSNFAREGRINKLVLLHGPNGSAKSSITRCMMDGLEHYSRLAEGCLYTFNWIFPSMKSTSAGIGFGGGRSPATAKGSFAYLSAEDIDARVPSEMHDHPILLIPQGQREEFLSRLLPDTGAEEERSISDYLRFGDLSHKNRSIFDALLASYDGDVTKVLDHIQVERLYLSRRYRRGIATVEPQMSVDARIQQLTADRSMASLPKALQHVSLYEPAGPLVDANRGILEFSDMLKRPVEAFKYLLSTVETASVSMDSFVLQLDMLFMASTNEIYLEAFKEHPDFASFKGRMELIKVPYLLRYNEEVEIYRPQLTAKVVGKHLAPHSVEVAALWAILTRMRRADHSLYDKELGSIVDGLTPLEKLRLYDTGEVPERLTSQETKELRGAIPAIYRECLSYPNYEGRFGASAREVRTLLLNAAHNEKYACLSPLAVFEEIRQLLAQTSVYDFLKQEVLKGYHDHKEFLEVTEELYLDWIDDEIRDSMGLAGSTSYVDLFTKYVLHVSHWVKRERLMDPTSGQLIDPDKRLMDEVERVLLGEGEKAEDFRKSIIGTIGARSLDDPDTPPALGDLFKAYIHRLKEDFYDRQRKVVHKMIQSFLSYTSYSGHNLSPKEVTQTEAMLETLSDRYGYNADSARDAVAYILKKRYAE